MNFYFATIQQMAGSLKNLLEILKKTEEHTKTSNYSADNFLGMRMFPNMLPFSAQIRIACDSAKNAAAYLTRQVPPVHEDNEQIWSDFKDRLLKTINYLESFKESDFEQADNIKIDLKQFNGKYMNGHDYLICRQVPNFYFHVVTAYNLLRMGGVDIGKSDYLGNLPMRDN